MRQDYINDCPGFLMDFLTNLKLVRDRADRTEEAYYIDIRTFLRYLKSKNGLVSKDTEYKDIRIADTPFSLVENFTINDAYMYLRYLRDERHNSTATRARKCSSLKQFYFYLNKKAMRIKSNPVADLELPKVKNKLPKFLSLEESKQLLGSVDSSNAIRDYCILTLFLNCGMRLSELVGLDLNDYSRDNRTLRLFGKGSKERIVYLNDACVAALEAYLTERASDEKNKQLNAMFISRNHTRISTRRVQLIVEENLKKAGLANIGISTHKLRHTAATLMYQHGNVDTLVLKEILGHKSISTTEIYTHLGNESIKQAAEASPLADMKLPSRSKKSK